MTDQFGLQRGIKQSRLWRLMATPVIEDEEQQRVAALLNPVTITVALFGVLAAIVAYALDNPQAAIAIGVMVGGAIGSFLLLRRHQLIAAAHLLLMVTVGGFIFLIYNSDGIHDIAIMAFPVLVLIGGLLLDRRAFAVFVILTATALLVDAIGERSGMIVNNLSHFTSSGDVIYLLILLSATAAVSFRLSKNILRNYEKVRSARTALQRSNDMLSREIVDRKRSEAEREKLILNLQRKSNEVAELEGMLPICASCKKIRDDRGYWHQVEIYIRNHAKVDFSHGMCPDCIKNLYPELADDGDGPSK